MKLSRRERQVADLMVAGLTDAQIAAQLAVSRYTINTYSKSLFRKLKVHKRSAVAAALPPVGLEDAA